MTCVIIKPATLGPNNIAGNMSIPSKGGTGRPRNTFGAMTASAAVQEIAKVRKKYDTTGWLVRGDGRELANVLWDPISGMPTATRYESVQWRLQVDRHDRSPLHRVRVRRCDQARRPPLQNSFHPKYTPGSFVCRVARRGPLFGCRHQVSADAAYSGVFPNGLSLWGFLDGVVAVRGKAENLLCLSAWPANFHGREHLCRCAPKSENNPFIL